MNKLFTLSVILLLSLTCHAQAWVELGSLNANASIWSIITDPSGNVYAAGGFTDSATYIEGHSFVAKWNGTGWARVGTGSNALNANNAIRAVTRDLAGNIYAAGSFIDTNGREYVAQWNGSTWTELGIDTIGLNATQSIYALTTDNAANVYAAGDINDSLFGFGYRYVAKWNGSRWSDVGLDSTGHNSLSADSSILALAADRHGNVFAAGAFTDSLGYAYVAKWNGTTWSKVGTDSNALNANGQISAMITDTAGNIYAGGTFTDSLGYYYIAKWNGTTWTELSNPNLNQISILGPINALALDSVGNVYAGGMVPDTSGNFFYVVVWNGTRLLVADNSGSAPLNANAAINTMAADKFGNIYAAGNFTDANMYQYVAEFTGNIPSGISSPVVQQLHLYPNPANTAVYLQAQGLNGTGTLTLYDALGRPLQTQTTEGPAIQIRLSLTDVAPGIYTIQLKYEAGNTYTSRLVKQ